MQLHCADHLLHAGAPPCPPHKLHALLHAPPSCRALLAQGRFAWAAGIASAEPSAPAPAAQQAQQGSREHAWRALQALHSGGCALAPQVPPLSLLSCQSACFPKCMLSLVFICPEASACFPECMLSLAFICPEAGMPRPMQHPPEPAVRPVCGIPGLRRAFLILETTLSLLPSE